MSIHPDRLRGSGPEPFDACPDGGRCWHGCPGATEDGAKGLPCWRVLHAAPFGPDHWAHQVTMEHTLAERVSDDDLRALSSQQRAVIRKAAKGGWVRSPGAPAVEAVERLTGLAVQSEQVRGEPRAYYAAGPDSEAGYIILAARLKALR